MRAKECNDILTPFVQKGLTACGLKQNTNKSLQQYEVYDIKLCAPKLK